MKKIIRMMFVVTLVMTGVHGAQAANVDGVAVDSNQVDVAQLRLVAEEQQTNAVAWLNYGRAARQAVMDKDTEWIEKDFDEAIHAFEKGLLLDPKNPEIHYEIARTYGTRAYITRDYSRPGLNLDDLNKALEHYSLALTNELHRVGKRSRESDIARVKKHIDGELEQRQAFESHKKQLAEEEKLPMEEKLKLQAERERQQAEFYKRIREENKRRYASEENRKRLEELKQRAKHEPENASVLVDYAAKLLEVEFYGLENRREIPEVQTLCKKAIELDKHNGRAYEIMGLYMDLRCKFSTALSYYKKALAEGRTGRHLRDQISRLEKREALGRGEITPENIARAKKEAADRYSAITGKEANRANLIQSLLTTNADFIAIPCALNLIQRSAEKGADLVQSIEVCYQQNQHWFVRFKCVETLSELDETKADELARGMVSDSNLELDARLLIARLMLKKGKLFGYPVLREGLASTKKPQQMIAADLLDEFEQYDGQEYDQGGGKINVGELRRTER